MPKTIRTEQTRGTGKNRQPRGTNDTETKRPSQARGTTEDHLLDALRADPTTRPPSWQRRPGLADPRLGRSSPAWQTQAS